MLFPPDGYYRDTLRGNPAMGRELVKTLRDEIVNSGFTDDFYRAVGDQDFDGLTPGQLADLRGFTGLIPAGTIDDSNMCSVLEALRAALRQMHYVDVPDCRFAWVGPADQGDCVFRAGRSVYNCAVGDPCPPHACGCTPSANPTGCGDCCALTYGGAWSVAEGQAQAGLARGWYPASNPPCGGVGPQVLRPYYFESATTGLCTYQAPNGPEPGYTAQIEYSQVRGRVRIDLVNENASALMLVRMTKETESGCQATEITPGGAPLPPDDMDDTYRGIFNASPRVVSFTPVYGDVGVGMLSAMPDPPPAGSLCNLVGQGQSKMRQWAVTGTKGVMRPKLDTRPDVDACGDLCSSCIPGKVDPLFDGVNFLYPLGRTPDGTPAGYIQIRGSDLIPGVCLPEDIVVHSPINSGVQVTRLFVDPGECPRLPFFQGVQRQVPRQVDTGAYFVDIVPISCDPQNPCGYQLKFYLRSQVIGFDSETGLHMTQGDPYATSCVQVEEDVAIADPRGGMATSAVGTRLQVTSTGDLNSGNWRVEHITEGGRDDWLFRSGVVTSGGQTTTARIDVVLNDTLLGGDVQETRLVMSGSGQVVSRSGEVRREFAWGEEVITRFRGGGTVQDPELIDEYSYYDNPATDGAAYSRLKHEKLHTGFWRNHEYDSSGRTSRVISQFKANAWTFNPTTAAAVNRVQEWSYPAGIDMDGQFGNDRVEIVAEKLAGVAIGRSYTVHLSPQVSSDLREMWTIRCADPSAPASDQAFLAGVYAAPTGSGDQVSINVRREESVNGFPVLRSVRSASSSGRVTLSTRTNLGGGVIQTEAVSGPGTADLLDVRTGLGTRSVTTRQASGSITESIAFDRGDLVNPTSWTWSDPQDPLDVDVHGRILRRHALDGTVSQTHYNCCGVEWEQGSDGIRIEYVRDALGRVVTTRRQVSASAFIETTVVYDAAGNVVSSSRRGTDSSVHVQGSSAYDLAGRLVQTSDALGNITSYAEELHTSGLMLSTTILPDPDGTGPLASPVIYRWAYPDGSDHSVSGTGAHPQAFDYGVATITPPGGSAAAMTFVTEYIGSAPAQWTTTYTNALGQSVLRRTESPAPGGGNADTWTFYDDRGDMVATSDPDGVTNLSASGYGSVDAPAGAPTSAFSWDGAWSLSVQDLNQDGVIDFGSDRIAMTRSFVTTRTVGAQSVPVHRSESRIWTTDADSSTTYLASVSDRSFDGLQTWQDADGKTVSTVTLIEPAQARRTVTTTLPNGNTEIQISNYARSDSSEARGPANEFLRKSTTAYDPHSRVASTTFIADPNNSALDATTTLTYDAADRLLTQTDPEPNASAPYVGQKVTTYAYDGLGRVTSIQQSDGTVTKTTLTAYAPTGETVEVSGFGANPVRYVYDDRGRMVQLKTYKDGPPNWTGEAVTTWNYAGSTGVLTSKMYADGNGPIYQYTAAGRLAARHSQRNSQTVIGTAYEYDNAGQLKSIDYDDGTQDVAMTYDRMGRMKTVTDAAGLRTLTYDNAGRVHLETIEFDSASAANLLAGVRVDNEFDSLGRRTKLATSIGGSGVVPSSAQTAAWSQGAFYAYDSQWRIGSVYKDEANVVYQYHEPTGQVKRVEYRAAYGGVLPGDLTAHGDSAFDKLGRLKSIDWRAVPPRLLNRYEYTYDVFGRRIERADGLTSVITRWEYGYDDLNQLTSAAKKFDSPCSGNPGPYMPGDYFGYQYDDIGNRVEVREGGDTQALDQYSSGYTTNALNQYSDRQVSSNIEVLGLGSLFPSQIQSFTVNGVLAWKCKDMYHRRVAGNSNATSPALTTISITEIPGVAPFSFDVFRAQTPETFTYDLDGNLTQDGIWDYEWDAENRMTAMSMRPEAALVALGASGTWVRLEFGYDWMGRRISKSFLKGQSDPQAIIDSKGTQMVVWADSWSERFVYEPGQWQPGMTYRADTATGYFADRGQSFAWGPDMSGSVGGAGGIGGLAVSMEDNSSAPGYGAGPMVPVYDGHGNITRLYTIDFPSFAMASYEYGPFGEVRSITGTQGHRNPFRWSTKWTDAETGLVYYGYRYYSPGMGRWINRDPIEEGDGVNSLCYIRNNPGYGIDAAGLARLIIGFGGLLEGAGLSAPVVKDRWREELAGPDNEFKFFAQDDVAGALALVLNRVSRNVAPPAPPIDPNFMGPPAPRGCEYDTLIILGFSNGGDAALDLAERLNLQSPAVKVNLVFVCDVVPRGLGGLLGRRLAKPPNSEKLVNIFQTFGGIHGHPVNGAPEEIRYDRPRVPTGPNGEPLVPDATTIKDAALRQLWIAHLQNQWAGAHVAVATIDATIDKLKESVDDVPTTRKDWK